MGILDAPARPTRTGSAPVGQGETLVNVRDFGALGDGTADDTTAIQAALNSLVAGGRLLIPPGTYNVTATLTLTTSSVIIEGAGRGNNGNPIGAVIRASIGVNVLMVTANAVTIKDVLFLSFDAESSIRSGQATAITFVSGSLHKVTGCRFTYFHHNVWFKACDTWVVSSCHFQRFTGYGIYVQNTASPDAGDAVLDGNWFVSGTTAGSYGSAYTGLACVRQESSGGLKMVGNKLFGGKYGYDLAIADDASTSVLTATGNSFELQTFACLHFTSITGTAGTGTGFFGRVTITGNQINADVCATSALAIEAGSPNMFREFIFNSNVCHGTSALPQFVKAAYLQGLVVVGNIFANAAGVIQLDGNCGEVTFEHNQCTGISGGVFARNDSGVVGRSRSWGAEKKSAFDTSSSTVYSQPAAVGFNATGSCLIDLTAYGIQTGGTGGPIAGHFRRLVTCVLGDPPVVSVVGTDTVGPVPFDVLFDPSVNFLGIKIKRNSGDGGTQIQGALRIAVSGQFQSLQ